MRGWQSVHALLAEGLCFLAVHSGKKTKKKGINTSSIRIEGVRPNITQHRGLIAKMNPHEYTPMGHHPDPSETTHTATGLSNARIHSLPRIQSYGGFVRDTAPMSGSAGIYGNPLIDPAGTTHQNHEDLWSPPLTGRTLGGFSPEPSPGADSTQPEDLRPSPQSTWDKITTRTHYRYLENSSDSETRPKAERDIDTMSLDSLQMHGEATKDPDPYQTDYDTSKTRVAGEPTLPPKPPTNIKIGRTSGLAIWLLAVSIYSTIMSGIWLATAIAQPRWGTMVSSHGTITPSTASFICAILAKTIEMSFVTVFVAFIGQVLTRRAIATKGGMTLSEMSMRTWVTVSGRR